MPEFLGKGFAFPLRLNSSGSLSYVEGEQSIAQSIWVIISTPLRSRIMEPEFGCNIHDYLFAPNTPNTLASIVQGVQRALVRFEPRIDVLDVQASSNSDAPNALMVNVDYRVRANNAMHNLVYPFYINEGAA
ncbi:MAG: phage baseplate assembly protein W [Patiriisocius sp.]|jgi:phage baseplate assembly protein W